MRLATLLVLLFAAGCSPGLGVDTYPTKPGTEVDCKALFADSPQKVAGEKSILVKDDLAAAWGAPPIIMRCGVERPDGYTATSECNPVGELCWYPEKIKDGYVFTVTGREFFVSLEVPEDYTPFAGPLADVTDAITKHDPKLSY